MPQRYTLKHHRSPDFRSGVADHALVNILGDQTGARAAIVFSRLDIRTSSESAIKEDNGNITIPPGTTPDFDTVRTLEFSVDMRPDHILALANAIRVALAGLPEGVRKQYGIKDEDILKQG